VPADGCRRSAKTRWPWSWSSARRPYLAFSTLKDRYSDVERERLLDLVSRGYKVIALTREELDPYDLHKRFERLPRLGLAREEGTSVASEM